MIYYILAVALFGLSIYVAKKCDYTSCWEIPSTIGSVVSGLYVLAASILMLVSQTIEYSQFKAEYDQVAVLIKDVRPEAAEDLVAKVVTVNATIAKARLYNTYTFFDPYWSDRFNDLAPIELPAALKISR